MVTGAAPCTQPVGEKGKAQPQRIKDRSTKTVDDHFWATNEQQDTMCSLSSPVSSPSQASVIFLSQHSSQAFDPASTAGSSACGAGFLASPPASPMYLRDSVLIACFGDLLQRELETTTKLTELKTGF